MAGVALGQEAGERDDLVLGPVLSFAHAEVAGRGDAVPDLEVLEVRPAVQRAERMVACRGDGLALRGAKLEDPLAPVAHYVGDGALAKPTVLTECMHSTCTARAMEFFDRRTLTGGGVDDGRAADQALVEAVAREELEQPEDAIGVGLVDALPLRAVDERALLLRHLLGLLLAHRAAQEVGAAERVARERLRDLHDLLLVDDDAVGRLQDVVDQRVHLRDRLATVLAVDEVLHHAGAERTRAVERDRGDDVLEAVGARSLKSCCMPLDSSWNTPLVSPDAEELVAWRLSSSGIVSMSNGVAARAGDRGAR